MPLDRRPRRVNEVVPTLIRRACADRAKRHVATRPDPVVNHGNVAAAGDGFRPDARVQLHDFHRGHSCIELRESNVPALGGKVRDRRYSELERAMSVRECVRHVEAAGRVFDIALAARAALTPEHRMVAELVGGV